MRARGFREIQGDAKNNSTQSVCMTIYIPAETFYDVEALAKKANIPMSRQIALLVAKGLEK